jgi:hypothetical protein
MQYYLQMDETLEIVESHQIVIDSEIDADFIAEYSDLLAAAADGDADASNELWYLALDAGIVDEYLDRDILDSTNTDFSCQKWGEK